MSGTQLDDLDTELRNILTSVDITISQNKKQNTKECIRSLKSADNDLAAFIDRLDAHHNLTPALRKQHIMTLQEKQYTIDETIVHHDDHEKIILHNRDLVDKLKLAIEEKEQVTMRCNVFDSDRQKLLIQHDVLKDLNRIQSLELDQINNHKEMISSQYNDLQEKYHILETENKSLLEKIHIIIREMNNMYTKNESLAQTSKMTNSKNTLPINALQTTLDDALWKNDYLKSENSAMKNNIAEMRQTLKDNSNEISKLKSIYSQLNDKLKEKNLEIETLTKK